MRSLKNIVLAAALGAAFLLAGCGSDGLEGVLDYYTKALDKGADVGARAVETYCDKRGEELTARQESVAAVNAKLKENGSAARLMPLDCDGDLAPDFAIEEPPEVEAAESAAE